MLSSDSNPERRGLFGFRHSSFVRTWGLVILDSLFHKVLLKHHQVVRVRRIPADADDVVAKLDGEVDKLALVVHALAADVFVAMILRPGLLCLLQLPANALAAEIGADSAEPVIKHPGLKLKTDPETHRAVADAGQQRQRVVSRDESTFEIVQLALRTENRVVNLDGLRQKLVVGNDDIG